MSRSLVLASLSAQLPNKTNFMTTTNTQGLPDLTLLFPVRIFKITLRFTRKSSFPFLHHAIVNGFVRNLTNPSDPQLAPPAHKEYVTLAPESGRIEYHAGDTYCFFLIAFAGIAPSINRLFEQLNQLPASARKQGCTRQLSDNNELISIQDAISLIPLENPEQAQPLTLEQFIETAAQLHGSTANVDLMIGPLRMLREKENVNTKTAAKFCTKKSEFTGTLFFQRIYDSINNLVVELGGQRQRRSDYTQHKPYLDNIATQVKDAFWVDSYYQNNEEKPKENGGLFVHCELQTREFTQDDFLLLLIGELLGICQKRNFGYGRYTTGLRALPRFVRDSNLSNLLLCQTETTDEKNQEIIKNFLYQSLAALWNKNFLGYSAKEKYEKKDDISRLKELHKSGYHYSLSFDLSDLYPLVEIPILYNRLNLLFGTDPLWVQIERGLQQLASQTQERGLPKNHALSKCLTYFILNSFDVLTTSKGHFFYTTEKFLILTRKQEEAIAIKNALADFLATHGLTVNTHKAQIRSVSDGIYFLDLFKN